MKYLLLCIIISFSTLTFAEENESEVNRQDKNYQALMHVGGSVLSLPSNGFGAYKYLEKNKLIGLHYFQMSEGADPSLFEGRAMLASFKEFRSNSFYYELFGYYRDIDTTDKIKTFNSVTTFEGKASFRDVGLGIKIGNQWQWEYFTLGCDWIGIAKRVATLKYEGDSSDFFKNSADLTFLNFYIGASF